MAKAANKLKPLLCACGWEIPRVLRALDGRADAKEVLLECPICFVPIRARIESAQ